MKKLVFISALLIIASCSLSKNDAVENVTINENKVNTRNLVAILGETKIQSKEFTIKNAVVNGNILELEVTYFGSCQAHDFICTGSAMISKSLPPIRSIQLVHFGKEDSCKELVTEVLKIDITALTYKPIDGSQIKLNLEGWQEQLMYTYSAKTIKIKEQQRLDSKGLPVEKKK
jgi:hypothetical protein